MRRLGCLIAAVLVASLTSGCAAGGAVPASAPALSPSPPPSASPGPTPRPTDPAFVLIRGTSTCNISAFESHLDGANEVVVEHFSCRYHVSDPRLNGRAEADFTTTFEPAEAGAARWEGTVTITNDDGAWTGPAEGALVMWPGASGPYNYGGGTYVGSGAYEGLEYHELVMGTDSGIVVTGWIETAD